MPIVPKFTEIHCKEIKNYFGNSKVGRTFPNNFVTILKCPLPIKTCSSRNRQTWPFPNQFKIATLLVLVNRCQLGCHALPFTLALMYKKIRKKPFDRDLDLYLMIDLLFNLNHCSTTQCVKKSISVTTMWINWEPPHWPI